MKILRITSLGYEAGGTETGIVLMNAALREMGHEVKVFSSDARPELPHFSNFECVSLERQPFFLRLFYRLWYPQAYFAARRALKAFQPDVVQVHTLSHLSPSVLFALRDYPTLMTIHGAEDFTARLLVWAFPPGFFKDDSFSLPALTFKGKLHYWYHRYLSRAIYHFALRRVDEFIVFSTFMQDELRRDGIDAYHIANFTRLYAYKPLNINSRMILYAGRLEKVKGIGYLIESMRIVLKAHPNATLMIAGEGSYQEELKALARPLAERVHFVGHLTREELGQLYEQAAVVVVPSVWPEAFGKIGIEAMSVGRPMVATNVGGIAEWMSEEVGYLVPSQSSEALASSITTLLSNDVLRERMSIAAAQHAKNFSIEKHIQAILPIYERMVQSGKKLRRE